MVADRQGGPHHPRACAARAAHSAERLHGLNERPLRIKAASVPPPILTLTESPSQSSILAAIVWLRTLVSGPIAAAIGTIAVAAVGLSLLGGRLDMRRAGLAVIGLFLVFGSSQIARSLAENPSTTVETFPSPQPATPFLAGPPSNDYDPYAGATMH